MIYKLVDKQKTYTSHSVKQTSGDGKGTQRISHICTLFV